MKELGLKPNTVDGYRRFCYYFVEYLESKRYIFLKDYAILASLFGINCFKSMDEEGGAQIDLIIDRRDHVISLCEIRFSIHEFEIDKLCNSNLRNRIDLFRRNTGTSKTLQLVMITTYGVRKNKYSSIVSGQVATIPAPLNQIRFRMYLK